MENLDFKVEIKTNFEIVEKTAPAITDFEIVKDDDGGQPPL